jgi:peptidoglycan/xylan/chitin deacetylase (PgdA/CDA1 family)
MRLDRLITLNLVQPVRRAWLKVQGSRFKIRSFAPSINSQLSTINSKWAVPILMYHSISDDPEPGVSPYYQTHTSSAVFRRQMQFLADNGYRTLALSELVEFFKTGAFRNPDHALRITHHASATPSPLNPQPSTLKQKLVCITFDDGFRDFYTEAFPVLREHGFTATMFLPTAFIGDERRQFGPSTINSQLSTTKDCLTWSEVRELRQAGIHFGSHTVNHPKLVELDWPQIRSELSNSKSEIEQQLGEPVTSFCYPYAFPQTDRQFVHRFAGLLSDTGYRSCGTTELGRVRPGAAPFRLARLPANSLDDLALFAAKLDGAYDWLGSIQTLSKELRRRRKARSVAPAKAGTSSPAAVEALNSDL